MTIANHSDTAAIKDTVRRHWDHRAATFDNVAHHGLRTPAQLQAWHARIAAWAGTNPIDVLDVGCGTGFFALQFAELGHRVTGLDIADQMLTRARAKAADAGAAIRFDLGDAEAPNYADASFDLIVERHVIWTLPNPGTAARNWANLLRPNGHLVLVEGDWRHQEINPDYADIHHKLPLYGGSDPATLTDLVVTTGLTDVTVEILDDPVLWGESVERPRYALHAHRRLSDAACWQEHD